MSLKEKVPAILEYVKQHEDYLERNRRALDVYDGNLLPYIEAEMAPSFSGQYFNQIKHRITPINVLDRITEKTSKSYISAPERQPRKESPSQEKVLRYYERVLSVDERMQKADEYTNLFKGYALEPFIHQGKPKLRVLPYDRFLPYSDDPVDPTFMTVFIKFMGKRHVVKAEKGKIVQIYHLFSADEFLSIDSDGDTVDEDMELNEGENPYGVIPFIYGNRGNDVLVPVQDTDTMRLTTLIPILLSDLSGAIMFQCFSIVYGIDVNAENLTMSPNAFWSLKSDSKSDKPPSVGTIKPEADIEKVLGYVTTVFSFWLETRGIRVGSLGSISAGSATSGISKIIDEMDTSELIQKSQKGFQHDEAAFWRVLGKMHDYWVSRSMITDMERPGSVGGVMDIATTFDAPQPITDRKTQVDTLKAEVDAGFTTREKAISALYPDYTEEQVDEVVAESSGRSVVQTPPPPEDMEGMEDAVDG